MPSYKREAPRSESFCEPPHVLGSGKVGNKLKEWCGSKDVILENKLFKRGKRGELELMVFLQQLQRQDTFPWDKVPDVPRPSQVPDPFTVWGRKKQDPAKEFYQYATLREKEGTVRGKNPSKDDHTRQLVESGAVSKVGLDAAAELALRGHVFEHGVLSRPPTSHRRVAIPPSSRTKIIMNLEKPSWYRF